LQFGFEKLPTYGLMKEYKEKEITDLIHVLTADGYLVLSDGQYPTVRLAQKAVDVLQGKAQVLQKVRLKKEVVRADDTLFELLRQLRKEISSVEKVPPYIIFADSTLREMSEQCPTDERSMRAIKGVGEAKFERYGEKFLTLLRQYAEKYGVKEKSTVPAERTAPVKDDIPSHIVTLDMFRAGRSIEEIVKERELKIVTVQDHIIRCATEGHEVDWSLLIPEEQEPLILAAIEEHGGEKLKPLKDALPPEVDYMAIKAVLCKRHLQSEIALK
jgi:ATP-dependent DNA helicase RecQ